MDDASIINWITRLEAASDPTSLPKPAPIASPPLSHTRGDDNNMTSTPKKRRRTENSQDVSNEFDLDATPRQETRSIPSSAASLSTSTGSMSRSSLVKGQMMRLRPSDTGIETKLLNADSVPAVAKPLFLTMVEIDRRLNILPDALRDTIRDDQGLSLDDFESQWQYSFKPANKPDTLPGRIPSIAQLKIILARAIECENSRHEEASWNAMVHLTLLRLIFENDPGQQCGDFNAMIW